MPRRSRTRSLVALAVSLTGCAAMSGVASSAVNLSQLRFFPPGSPFAGTAPTTQSVAVNSRGDVVVGEEVRSRNGAAATPTVRFRNGRRGPWSPTIMLAKPSTDTSEPRVAINARGARIATFHRLGRYVGSRQRGSSWRLSDIGAPAPTTDDVSAITITATGSARFVHALPDSGCSPDPDPCPWTVWVYDQSGPTGLWTRSDHSLRVPPTQRPSLTVSERGDVLVAWAAAGSAPRIHASRRLAADSAFEAPLSVSPPSVRGDVHAAIGPNGDAAVAWVQPDAPGAGSAFTGRIDVATRRATLPVWATPETVVPAGTANPDLALGVDSSANVALAWTTLSASAGGPSTLDAATRSAATSTWIPSPRLDSAAGGDGESLDLGTVFAGGGRAYVTYDKRLSAASTLARLAIGAPAGWSVHALTGNADPTAAPRDAAPRPVAAVAPNGNLVLVAPGLQVRNVDAAPTPPASRATGLRVRVTGRTAELRFRLNTSARIYVQRRGGTNFATIGEYAPATGRAGANRFALGRLPAGRYLVGIGACNRARGCSATKLVAFRIR